jgi:predicted nicotinamide N-methyase
VELGAGCGLVSVALLHAGAARVVATDLPANTKLLRANVFSNAPSGKDEGHAWDVKALSWGKDANEALGDEPFDLVIATDCMYVAESACLLADTLEALVGEKKNPARRSARRCCSRTAATDKPSLCSNKRFGTPAEL